MQAYGVAKNLANDTENVLKVICVCAILLGSYSPYKIIYIVMLAGSRHNKQVLVGNCDS